MLECWDVGMLGHGAAAQAEIHGARTEHPPRTPATSTATRAPHRTATDGSSHTLALQPQSNPWTTTGTAPGVDLDNSTVHAHPIP